MSRKNRGFSRQDLIEQAQASAVDGPDRFELKLANGKTRSFKTGVDMWRFAVQNNPKMEFPQDDKAVPTFSDWMEKRRK